MNIKKYWYPFTIIGIVLIGYFFSEYFISIGDLKFSTFIKPVLQVIMFGMGATMTVEDFVGVIKTPQKVIVGLIFHFFFMPLLGFILANTFDFEPEIAAGIILIGCSPSGLASNVMAMMAKANVALSITITAMATLLAPVLTPLLMKLLGGSLIEINFWDMFFDMGKIVILPVVLGVILNKFFPKIIVKFKDMLPYFSMAGIAYVILIVTANGQASLKSVGLLLVLVMFIHNVGGYFLGYFSARLLKMNQADARAVAFEVGMQNGGLASALANEMGKIATVGLASAIFGPLMNVTASILANYWGTKPPKD
ncbi:MAG: bile acid:sodium symporter family protein [Leadbetterella sp.]|jgi:BASS family bile acid:Na+ symporter|nr:bile acid:sodium symporter family protein [Leadbetterella sp.]